LTPKRKPSARRVGPDLDALSYRGKKEYRVAFLSLEVPRSLPHIEWLDAYRKFFRSI
jgi:hypothetical protein